MHRMAKNLASILSTIALIGVLTSCDKFAANIDDYQNALKSASGKDASTNPAAASGESAAYHLAPALKVRGQSTDAILKSMDISASLHLPTDTGDGGVFAVDEDTKKMLVEMEYSKRTFDSNHYQKLDEQYFNPAGAALTAPLHLAAPTISWSATKDEFLVANVDKIPVKDQGARSTCSSFSGIGQIEAMILKNTTLSSVDLSEQRFYYMSKPDHWQTGGDTTAGGSNAGTGFAKSNGFNYKGVTYPPDSSATFNLPLENLCPYNKDMGENDLQTPQQTSCLTGVAKVTDFVAWLKENDQQVYTAQKVMDLLLSSDLPVIVASKLTSNWEVNNGMITLAESTAPGATIHAYGHAYLIVGAKKISEVEYPNEGGMCFIIKNSWGSGWGNSGYSCMTLAWFNQYMYTYGFPQVRSLDIDVTALKTAYSEDSNPPSTLIETEYDSGETISDQTGSKRRGKVTFGLTDDRTFAVWEYLGSFYKIFYQNQGDDQIKVFGLLKDGKTVTKPITLQQRDNKLYLSLNGIAETKVGRISNGGEVTLCSGDFIDTCNLNYDSDRQGLTIGLTDNQVEVEEASEPFEWKKVSINAVDYFFSHPSGVNNIIDVKIEKNGIESNPLRFRINIENGEIRLHGKTIGSFKDESLCNKDYAKTCFIVMSGNEFKILFR